MNKTNHIDLYGMYFRWTFNTGDRVKHVCKSRILNHFLIKGVLPEIFQFSKYLHNFILFDDERKIAERYGLWPIFSFWNRLLEIFVMVSTLGFAFIYDRYNICMFGLWPVCSTLYPFLNSANVEYTKNIIKISYDTIIGTIMSYDCLLRTRERPIRGQFKSFFSRVHVL